MFREERDQSQFEWSMLGDLKEGRPNLGPMTHVAVYRLMQYTLRDVLIQQFGVVVDRRETRLLSIWRARRTQSGYLAPCGRHKQTQDRGRTGLP